jgi:hypothetical protein
MKQRNVEEKIQVLDIAELVAQSIPDVPVGSLVRKKDRAGAGSAAATPSAKTKA